MIRYNTNRLKTVGDPSIHYERLKTPWERARAVIGGQKHAKEYDSFVDTTTYRNLLLPFSPSMSQEQYDFFKAEAELPGLTSQYAKVLLGGLLRKQPQFKLPDDAPEGAQEWIDHDFTAEGRSLLAFLDEAIWEELQSSRCWILVDHPEVPNPDLLTPEQIDLLQPYPMVLTAESIINWRKGVREVDHTQVLSKFTIRFYREDYTKNRHHPDYIDTVMDYYLDDDGLLVIDTYERVTREETPQHARPGYESLTAEDWKLIDTKYPEMQGERLSFIPAFPLNGQVDPVEPVLQPLIDREISLYNKISRRNHLLYGASTYTPVVMSDMSEEEFGSLVDSGLGSWLKLNREDRIDVLKAPSEPLKDMDRAIESTVEEMAKMGVRMLAPETSSQQSGIALEIRNASQTVQLGLLNAKISKTMQSVIATMLNWKYGTEYRDSDIQFSLSADFNPAPIGADWMRLVTDWYQQGLIPRSTFLAIAKQNDIIPVDYDDERGLEEISKDPLVNRSGGIDMSLFDDKES